jgi:hypothetical protein
MSFQPRLLILSRTLVATFKGSFDGTSLTCEGRSRLCRRVEGQERHDSEQNRIGASEAGWIAPLAASLSPDVAFLALNTISLFSGADHSLFVVPTRAHPYSAHQDVRREGLRHLTALPGHFPEISTLAPSLRNADSDAASVPPRDRSEQCSRARSGCHGCE